MCGVRIHTYTAAYAMYIVQHDVLGGADLQNRGAARLFTVGPGLLLTSQRLPAVYLEVATH